MDESSLTGAKCRQEVAGEKRGGISCAQWAAFPTSRRSVSLSHVSHCSEHLERSGGCTEMLLP